MRIIGKTKNGFIIEAEENEVANLVGHYYYGGQCPQLSVGQSISVSGMYDHLRGLARNRSSLSTMAKDLRAYADLLEAKDPIITELTQEVSA